MSTGRGGDGPGPDRLVDVWFDTAGEALAAQRELTKAVFGAGTPMIDAMSHARNAHDRDRREGDSGDDPGHHPGGGPGDDPAFPDGRRAQGQLNAQCVSRRTRHAPGDARRGRIRRGRASVTPLRTCR
jgi:hypothetical protein